MGDDALRLRTVRSDDQRAVRHLALATGLFTADDVGGVEAVLAGHLSGERPEDHWVVAERGGRVRGAGYWAPEPFGDRVWNLYFLAVDPQDHGGAPVRRSSTTSSPS